LFIWFIKYRYSRFNYW